MKVLASLALTLLAGGPAAFADTFQPSYLASGVQSSQASTYVENFDSATKAANGTYTTTFNNSGITGTYSGAFNFVPAGQYGGAGGSGQYITTGSYSGTGTPYTLTLSQNVNYFSMWFSALDAGNQLSFYNGSNLLYTFNSATFMSAVGTCPASVYCGNPNNGQDKGELFAYINYYDTNGTFNKVVFTQGNGVVGDFESDNHTVGMITNNPGGTALASTPEPSSLALLGTGLLSVVGAARRRMRRS